MAPHRITKKKDHKNSFLESIHARNLLYNDFRFKSTRDAVHQAISIHIELVAQEFQPYLDKSPEKIIELLRQLIVRNRANFCPPEVEDADNEKIPETPMITGTHITTLAPVSQKELVVGETSPSTPVSAIQEELFIVDSPLVNHVSIKQEKIEIPPAPPIKEGPWSSEERSNEASDLDDLGVEIKLELSAEELRTVSGSPRRLQSPGFRRDKILAARQVPTIKQLYQDGYLTPVSDPIFQPSHDLNRVFSLFQYDIEKLQTDCRVILNKSVRNGTGVETAELDSVSHEFPIHANINVGQSRIVKAHQSPYEMTIYTVCPVYDVGDIKKSIRLLRLCYQNMFELAERNMMDSISLPPLAAEFGFPAREAAELTLAAISKYLNTEYSYEATLRRVIICGLNEIEIEPYRKATPLFHSTMPLVVPGLTNASTNDTDNKQEWLNKLAGKKISDSPSDVNTFAKKDLPESHRIIKPGDAMTMDYRQERLNIHLGEDDIVHDVNFG
ncbi:uncharacterized protein KD926_006635 [Aspergillus affinis]|uniref:uncharacterized protein n=1 Tax=Aspergillus affinis TaxID=1070780 RepID=UPI0022FDE4FB|nr:uncharacterized protein KD926_006635 [Aspergillus affinis]KAI9041561.1 hypothetical protein KD926_006635 [Aspergillus affinis]